MKVIHLLINALRLSQYMANTLLTILLFLALVALATAENRIQLSKTDVVEISKISSFVADGELSFAKSEKPDKLVIKMQGPSLTIKLIDGKVCELCAKKINMEPDLKIPTKLFEDYPFGQGKQPYSMVSGGTFEGSVSENDSEFIVSGPKGAVLSKVGKGFLILDGDAYILQTGSGDSKRQ